MESREDQIAIQRGDVFHYNIWGHSLCTDYESIKGQIYLGNEPFVSKMQNKIEKSQDDWSIKKKQKPSLAQPLFEIEKQNTDRNSTIVVAYATGAYSQPEITEHFELHPSTLGVIVRWHKNS